ncbi:MAG: MCP four helix bundle domain-containing protein [Candidatus Eisenbacteria bacterium]|nr:MCP four helix bundle domain-containing protein [Candidatus Eisenbacteria bacterium]
MRWFKDRSTQTKLMMAFGAAAMITAFVGIAGVRELSKLNGMIETMYTRDMVGAAVMADAQASYLRSRINSLSYLASEDKVEQAQYLDQLRKLEVTTEEQLARAEGTLMTEQGKLVFRDLRTSLATWKQLNDEAIRLDAAGQHEAGQRAFAENRGNALAVLEHLDTLIEMKAERGKQAMDEGRAMFTAARNTVTALILGGVAISILLGWIIARLIVGPLNEGVRLMESVAKGDFTGQLAVSAHDEVGRLAVAMNATVDAVRTALNDVRETADAVASAADQLAAASESISSGAQEQASSLEETASSLEEITSTVKQNADSAQQANQLASGARDVAEKGGRVVGDAVNAMGEINQSSKQIADIITTIDEIAFQTNLLALNAAVEAARAGEQGRGFAVVASEVRNLAQRSAGAAKEIKALIQDSVRKVENGAELVNASGQTLSEIVTSVKRVTDIVQEIAAASREQSVGIDQVNTAVTQMDTVTQANASQTEELSATAETLSAKGRQLQTLVARFKLDDRAHHQAMGDRARPRLASVPARKPRPQAEPTRRPGRAPALAVVNGGAASELDGEFEEF